MKKEDLAQGCYAIGNLLMVIALFGIDWRLGLFVCGAILTWDGVRLHKGQL